MSAPAPAVAMHPLDPIPASLWWHVAEMAEAGDETVAQFVQRALSAAVRPVTEGLVTMPVEDAVHDRWTRGEADREIGKALGITNEAVARHRRALNLPPNRKPRR